MDKPYRRYVNRHILDKKLTPSGVFATYIEVYPGDVLNRYDMTDNTMKPISWDGLRKYFPKDEGKLNRLKCLRLVYYSTPVPLKEWLAEVWQILRPEPSQTKRDDVRGRQTPPASTAPHCAWLRGSGQRG